MVRQALHAIPRFLLITLVAALEQAMVTPVIWWIAMLSLPKPIQEKSWWLGYVAFICFFLFDWSAGAVAGFCLVMAVTQHGGQWWGVHPRLLLMTQIGWVIVWSWWQHSGNWDWVLVITQGLWVVIALLAWWVYRVWIHPQSKNIRKWGRW